MSNKMRGIIPWFAQNSVAANLLLILIISLGLMQMGKLRKEAFPSLSPNSLTVSVTYDSGSAQQSEEGLAIKIEEELEDVLGIKTITSSSTTTGTTVTIEMKDDYDLDTLLRDVKSKVDAISNFPTDADKPVIEKAEREEHALWLQLYGEVGRHTLQTLAEKLKDDLLANINVNRVAISGDLDPMISVEIDEAQLQSYGLSLSDVEDAINNESGSSRTAVLRDKALYLQLKASEQAYLKEEFAAIPLVTLGDGSRIRLGDVAKIDDTFDDETPVLSRFNSHTSIALQVITTGQDDISRTVVGAKKVVEEFKNSGSLPGNVKLISWYDRSTTIIERLELLAQNALTGFLIVFILLALFLNLTVAFWVSMGLPFIFFGTLYFMGDSFAGLSLNEFTTFGFIMALGIVVDDAVVIGESIYTLRAKAGDTIENTIRGTQAVAVPTLFGVLTTVAAFYAISQVSGHMGELYSQFAIVVTICLVLSVIESKLILPSHLAHINTRRTPGKNGIQRSWMWVQKITDQSLNLLNDRIYGPLIKVALHHRYAVLVVFAGIFVFVISMPLTGMVRMSFFPDIPGDTVRAELTMKNDASYGQTHAALSLLESRAHDADRELRHTNDDENSDIAYLQVLSEADQSGSVKLQLTKDAPYDIDTFTRKWRELSGTPEGAKTLSVQNTPHMVDALRIELRSSDDTVLTLAGEAVKSRLSSIVAVSGIEDNLEPGQPQLFMELTPQGRALGFTTDMLAEQVLQAFSGQVVQRFQRSVDEVEVKVRYPEGARKSVSDVLNANVRTSDGTVVPLPSVANITYGYTRDTITRIDGKRAVYVSADVDKDIMSSTELVTQLQKQLVPKLKQQYPSLDIDFSGEAQEQAETQTSMVDMFILALFIIYFLLAIPLKSYMQPFLIMTAIPFGIVGAVLGHWINDLSLGILSLNGIIALSGVVVNDSLLLVSTFNDLRRHSDTSLLETVRWAGKSRLRAVLLTSLTTVAGLLPLLYETSHQAQFLIPAAVSLAYGIMFATVITLILIPVLLVVQYDIGRCLTWFLWWINPFAERKEMC
ncbi:AcrB/AcrD/AcrF family protein [Desulfobacter hydrogenophilus]|uniref:AcrB/AcrD/AcrF family protein n=1 Tax=Desulfobacter hydrogenophilus TaxID=2291 RepID=A0A328FDM5_9BACT|nr:efflux RND transporter permease subunit [Desulfobacter hydrogenophilus]NDY72231.1 efflux RND transporter permease subunit [Desulfobacter hydrogenophilus]QBH15087.1 efflux RND transporter permease subunit [Desulfobacter hydrogenophilus]RAM02236.1 AcrB/AcrD/AcrF family protein [Desulfobacter hydrogenophilus]